MIKTFKFPYIALALATIILFIVTYGSQLDDTGYTRMPLLTLLVMSEFAFFVSAIGCYIGISHSLKTEFKAIYTIATALCLLFAIRFTMLGITLWPL